MIAARFETPLIRYWRLLNEALEALSAKPVMFAEAVATKACWGDPSQGARFVARAQGFADAAPLQPPDL